MGAAFLGAESPSLLEGFHATGGEAWQLGLFHGDPTQAASPYNPVTAAQIRGSGLNYLALGHIHKGGSFRAGDTLCAWPGCPMGHGFDEDVRRREEKLFGYISPANRAAKDGSLL